MKKNNNRERIKREELLELFLKTANVMRSQKGNSK